MLTATHKRMLRSLEEDLRPEFDACLGFYGPQPWALYASEHSYNYSMGIEDAWSVHTGDRMIPNKSGIVWTGGTAYNYGFDHRGGDVTLPVSAHYPVPALLIEDTSNIQVIIAIDWMAGEYD